MRFALPLALTLIGCAPAASFRPASSAMRETRAEVGVGGAAIRPRRFVEEPTFFSGQAWGTRRLTKTLKASGILALDTDAAAGGFALGWIPLQRSWLAAGLEAELGYAWAALAVPFSIDVGKSVTGYASPRLGTWGDELSAAVPFGLSVDFPAGIELRGEAQVTWAAFEAYNRRWHLGVALVYQFGDSSKWASTGK